MRVSVPGSILILTVVALAGGAGAVGGCGQRADEQAPAAEQPAPTTTPAPDARPAPEAGAQAAGESAPERERLIPPIRGTAQVGFLAPKTSVEKDLVVTTFQVKNLSNGSIAGLKIDEFWWDRSGNPVTGDTARLTSPLKPGEVATMTLETPRNAKMFRNTYQFSHAYGRVETKQLKTLE